MVRPNSAELCFDVFLLLQGCGGPTASRVVVLVVVISGYIIAEAILTLAHCR